MDVIYWSFFGVFVRGFKYNTLLYGACEGVRFPLLSATRDKIPVRFDEWLTIMRADKRFRQEYKFCSAIHLDLAGEFTGEAFMNVLRKHQVHEVHWKDPSNKRDAGPIELQVGQFERAVKRSMLETSSPAAYFCYHVEYAGHVMLTSLPRRARGLVIHDGLVVYIYHNLGLKTPLWDQKS